MKQELVLMILTMCCTGGVGLSLSLHPSIGQSFRASCLIESQDNTGSGVLLRSGYIITTSHGIDLNLDGNLQEGEKKVQIQFWDPPHQVEGEVIFLGAKQLADVAFIRPKGLVPASNVRLTRNPPKVGTPVISIGCPMAGPPHITDGRISYPDTPGLGRSSVPIYFGNSGGGLFLANNDRECLGIMIRVMRHDREIEAQLPTGKLKLEIPDPVVNISEYLPAERIIWLAESQNLKSLVD